MDSYFLTTHEIDYREIYQAKTYQYILPTNRTFYSLK